jgi:putative spermidine/putrescine transport system permease protein
MTAHAWRSPCLLLAAPVLFFAAFFLAPLAVVGLGSATGGPDR